MQNNNNVSRSRVRYANNEGNHAGGGYFNCWGSTLYLLGLSDKLEWVERGMMDRFLHHKTKKVDKSKIMRGDIFAMWHRGYLEHTAVYLGNGRYFQKRGSNTSEITSKKGIFRIYKADKVEYRRVTA